MGYLSYPHHTRRKDWQAITPIAPCSGWGIERGQSKDRSVSLGAVPEYPAGFVASGYEPRLGLSPAPTARFPLIRRDISPPNSPLSRRRQRQAPNGVTTMASGAFSAEHVLPIRRLALRPATKPQARRAVRWPWRAIADAVSGIAFLTVLVWMVWHLGDQLLRVAGMMEAQVGAAGVGGLF